MKEGKPIIKTLEDLYQECIKAGNYITGLFYLLEETGHENSPEVIRLRQKWTDLKGQFLEDEMSPSVFLVAAINLFFEIRPVVQSTGIPQEKLKQEEDLQFFNMLAEEKLYKKMVGEKVQEH